MAENETRLYILKAEPVPRALLKLGIPTMTGMLVSALYNAVDAYFVGGLGTAQMGAVSVVFPIVQIIIGLGMMFGAGASSYISRLLGSQDYERASRTASAALFSGLLVGGIAISCILLFLKPVLAALGATATILPYARVYARIYVAGSILNVFNVTMNNLLTAQGAAKFTMTVMISGSLSNIILDPILIYGLDLGIEGAAIATVLSLCMNAALYIGYLLKGKGVLRFSFRYVSTDGEIYGEILKIGIPVLAFQLFTSAALGLTNIAAKSYGDYAVAAMGAVTRVMTIGIYIVFGFMKGFQPFAGFNYGARQYKRLKRATRLCLLGSTCFCVFMAAVCIFFATPIIKLFGSNPDMISLGARALQISAALFTAFGFQMVYASLYLSAGKSLPGSILSLGRQGIFFIPLITALPAFMGITGLILAQPLADLCSSAVTCVFAAQMDKRLGIPTKAENESKEGPYAG
ncbi:MATE family efflux transporter [Anaerovorax odorimutans]|uniref:Multidrug export protein MepA n=1 Tax=Anaerovorax odorimutans TaxID=109327 RepID=A0ABT1RJS9_9FIRM|nr:MATE family efflux transporter [Anaerovorax odorimutans]MCQ4635443.1 MATE family efflux transporter [Anaerovorax odorimutans]